MNILLIEPNFPKPSKSKNHNGFMPIGLLKLATYHRKKGNAICIVRGEVAAEEILFEHPNGINSKYTIPNEILITSCFTYWSKYVKKSVLYYKKLFPDAKIIVGGIYASLMPEHCKKYTKCDEVFVGVHEGAEKCRPNYRYIEKHYGNIDYQIIHTSRGCIRRCKYCGVDRVEPEFKYKSSIKDEIVKRNIVFYDNNLLANPHIKSILTELAYMKEKGKILWCEPQSGIDGRILIKNPELAFLMKKANFKNIRISWDGNYEDYINIEKQVNLLRKVGYIERDIFVFMRYNWEIPFEEMEKKRLKCWEWKVQISDCRFRPLNKTFDRYNGQMFRNGQTGRDYHIHKVSGWTDKKIRRFRQNIRRQNICIRLKIQFYSNCIERNFINKYVSKELITIAKDYPKKEIEPILNALKVPYWFPENFNGNGHHRSVEDIYIEYENSTNKKALKYSNIESSAFRTWRNKIHRIVISNLEHY